MENEIILTINKDLLFKTVKTVREHKNLTEPNRGNLARIHRLNVIEETLNGILQSGEEHLEKIKEHSEQQKRYEILKRELEAGFNREEYKEKCLLCKENTKITTKGKWQGAECKKCKIWIPYF